MGPWPGGAAKLAILQLATPGAQGCLLMVIARSLWVLEGEGYFVSVCLLKTILDIFVRFCFCCFSAFAVFLLLLSFVFSWFFAFAAFLLLLFFACAVLCFVSFSAFVFCFLSIFAFAASLFHFCCLFPFAVFFVFCVCLGFCCFVFFDSARLAFVAFVALLLFCDSALVASVDVGFCLAIYCSALVAVRSTVWCTTAQLAHTRVLLHLHKHILDREASIHFAHTSVMVVLRCWWEQTLKYSTA